MRLPSGRSGAGLQRCAPRGAQNRRPAMVCASQRGLMRLSLNTILAQLNKEEGHDYGSNSETSRY